MHVAAFVPAKAYSERIRNKNLTVLDGEYLFKRKLRQLLNCPEIGAVYLDTENDAMAALAADLSVQRLKRPTALASNSTDGHELFAWECSQAVADIYVQALCTAPFLGPDTIGRAIRALMADAAADSLIAVRSVKQYVWNEGVPAYGTGRIPNSVDLPATVAECMSLYMFKRQRSGGPPTRRIGKAPLLFEISPEEAVDLNTPEDLRLAERICAGYRAEQNLQLQALKQHLSSCILADIAKDFGIHVVLPPTIRPVVQGTFLGRAKTLELDVVRKGEDWKGIYNALESYLFVRPGDVIVVSTKIPNRAYFGDLNGSLAARVGAVGAVIDGFTRDSARLQFLNFPVYAHGPYCLDVKFEGTLRNMNMPITIGDITVCNNDIVFADADGVVIIPELRWPQFAKRACDVMDREWRLRLAVARGQDPRDIIAQSGEF